MNEIIPLQSVATDAVENMLNARESNSNMHVRNEIKEGDDLTFKSWTMYGSRKATRKVKQIDSSGRPRVRYDGWDNFQVRWNEVISINGWEVN